MRISIYLAIAVSLIPLSLAGCAGTTSNSSQNDDYVEIENPAFTMSPNAPATIWVPRRYVESGVPRGSELVKQGYEAVKGGIAQPPASVPNAPNIASAPPAAVAPTPPVAPVAPVAQSTPVVKSRVAVLEIGKNSLQNPFSDMLKKSGSTVLLDQSQITMLGRYASLAGQSDRVTFAQRLQEDYGANLLVVVSAPDGLAPGKSLKAEIYDCLGGGLVRTIEAPVAAFSENDTASKNSAVSSALQVLADQTKEVLSILPWYGKVVGVDGDRIYINSGKEAGIRLGQALKVYRGGKIVPGLGFAPGKMVGTFQVSGFVGMNGAFGQVKEGTGVQVSDMVGVE